MYLYKYHYYTHSTTFYYHSSTLVLFLSFSTIYMCQFLQVSAMWTLYWRILRTLILAPHHQANSRISQLAQCSHQFQLSLRKKIEPGAFIEMGDLIPTRLDTARLKLRRSVTDISSVIRSSNLSNCQKTTSLCSRPHSIPDSDSGSQQ